MNGLLSFGLWRELQTPPAQHWARPQNPNRRADQAALVLTFTLSALALISGVILNALVVYRATDRLARVREHGTFDLLAVTPEGGFGASWAIFAGWLHYSLTLRTLRQMRWNALRAVGIVGVVTLLPVFTSGLERSDPITQQNAWSWLLFLVSLLPLMFVDYHYAVVSGGLLSIVMAAVMRTEARAAALLAGAALHLTGYLAAAATGGLILPTVYQALGISGGLADVSRVLLTLAIFTLLHEAATLLLYRAAQNRLNGLAAFQPLSLHAR